MIMVGIANGIEMATLIPLLQLAGLGGTGGKGNYLSETIFNIFHFFGYSPLFGGVLLVFFLIFLSMSALQYWQIKLSSELSHNYSAYIRERLYNNLFNAQWTFFIEKKMAHSANILTAEAQRVRIALDSFNRVIAESFITTTYVVLAILISWQATASVLFAGAGVAYFMRKRIRSGKSTGKKITDANNALQSAVWEHLGNAKIIKSHAAEKQSFQLFHKLVFQCSSLYIRYIVNQAKIKAIFEPVAIAVLCVGFYLSLTFLNINSTNLVVLLLIFYRLSSRITLIQQDYHQLLTSIPAYNALIALEEETKAIPEYFPGKAQISSFEKGITLENVVYAYKLEDRDVIKDVNIFVPCGRTVALVGESGSGKSTIADLILGLLQPTKGNIYVDDTDLKDIDMKSWRSLIGYVTQDTILFHDTVLENLKWASPNATDEDLLTVLKIAAADGFVNNLSEGINTIIGDRGMRLSGGQRQRLALARALLRKPSLLILDEATSSLDAESENNIKNAIESLRGSITILVISHRLATVRNADIIYILDNGNIVGHGSWEELIRTGQDYFKRMCELQGLS